MMVALRSSEPAAKVEPESSPSNYEDYRKERIKENLQRMQELGIANLFADLPSRTPKRSLKKTGCLSPRSPIDLPPRRPQGKLELLFSYRLQNVTHVTYSELRLVKDGGMEGNGVHLREGSVPEVYTEEHLKLLGSWEEPWVLFQDGYSCEGVRIYDQVIGKTCHQCRQKTLGHRTKCSKCNLVQGQFCGDCLFMRYGENVLEANENPEWVCPVCRGICNCSLCRQKKGWAPTGSLYRRVAQLGYKSVAHYLIHSLQSKAQSEGSENKREEDATHRMSVVKISLDFSTPDHAKEPNLSTEEYIMETNREQHIDSNGFIDTNCTGHEIVDVILKSDSKDLMETNREQHIDSNGFIDTNCTVHEIVDVILNSDSKDLMENEDLSAPCRQKIKRNLNESDVVLPISDPDSIGARVRRRRAQACS